MRCEDAEKKARYVKAPLETGDVTSSPTLEQAVSEARTRLLSVHNERLRADLSKDIDGTYARTLAAIRDAERQKTVALEREAERQRAAAAAIEAERRKKLAALSKPAPPSVEQHRHDAPDFHELTKSAVAGLQVGVRYSALGDGTKVLVLRNPTPYPASFDLRCYTRTDAQKTFSMIIPAGGEKHFGFLQGWCGNFKDGERCEAYVDGERMWQYKIPAP
ncbi:MAG TPA: hypothetical protein VGR95_19770 [Thermoanaerobaculia bacterium]|nr:hypothetical protein [Thermoanaerobaculia bacterium]